MGGSVPNVETDISLEFMPLIPLRVLPDSICDNGVSTGGDKRTTLIKVQHLALPRRCDAVYNLQASSL